MRYFMSHTRHLMQVFDTLPEKSRRCLTPFTSPVCKGPRVPPHFVYLSTPDRRLGRRGRLAPSWARPTAPEDSRAPKISEGRPKDQKILLFQLGINLQLVDAIYPCSGG